MDRVTSLADLAFRGKTDKHYRQLAILSAAGYGRPDLPWKEAIAFLNQVAIDNNPRSCESVVRDVNYNRDNVREDWVEPPQQMELDEVAQKKIVEYKEWLKEHREREAWDRWAYRAYDTTNNWYIYNNA